MRKRDNAWVITVVCPTVKWRTASAIALVREAGLPLSVAARWAIARRDLGPAGLRRKLLEQVN